MDLGKNNISIKKDVMPFKHNIDLLVLKKVSVYLFFSWLLLLNISPLARIVDKVYFFVSSAVVILPLFFIFQKIYKDKGLRSYNKYLIIFILISLISCLVNFHGIPGNIKRVIWTSIYTLFIFSDDDLREVIENIKWIFLISMFISSSISIGLFFIQYSEQFLIDNQLIRIGFVENRLFGVYGDLNCASICSAICFFICLLNTYKDKNVLFLVINLIIQMAYISLSGSRACFLSLTISFYFFCFLFFCMKSRNNLFKSCIYSFLSTISLLMILKCLSYLLVESVNVLDFCYKTNVPSISLTRIDVERYHDYSNGRFALWLNALEIFKDNWILGVSPGNITWYAKQYCKGGIIDIKNYGCMHNIEIDILVTVGLFASIYFTVFLVKFIIPVVNRYIERVKNYSYDTKFDILIASTLCILISSFFMSEIVFCNTVETFLFWLFLSEIKREIQKNKENS